MDKRLFRFKQFEVAHGQGGLKVTTDGVLLGVLAQLRQGHKVLDIGAGTGLLSLMIAQRFPQAQLQAVEIDQQAAEECCYNFEQSPWSERLSLHASSFQSFAFQYPGKFDLIISNPPYFTQHLKGKDEQRNKALHNHALPFGDLMKGIADLLDQSGEAWLILPPAEMEVLEMQAAGLDLHTHCQYLIRDNPEHPVHREIRSFTHQPQPLKTQSLCIKDTGQDYSKAYRELLREFLIIF